MLPHPSRCRVGRPDNVGREHNRGVVLGDNEGRANNANRQSEEKERLVALGQTDAHNWNGADDQKAAIRQPGSNSVAEPTDCQPRHNRDGHGGDDRVADLSLGESKVVPHYGHQGRDAEPAEERQKEREPGEMERPHLRRLQTE